MVENISRNSDEYIKQLLGRSVEPYDSVSPLNEEEALDRYETWFEDDLLVDGFQSADKVIYHSAGSEEENAKRFKPLDALAFDMKADGQEPIIYVSEDEEDLVEGSEILDEGDVVYHESDTIEDEIRTAFELSGAERSIHVTSDYRAETVYRIREEFDDSDFVVLSADTSEIGVFPRLRNALSDLTRDSDW